MRPPVLPSEEIIKSVLPWWSRRLMAESQRFGGQKVAAKAVRMIWSLQTYLPWDPEVTNWEHIEELETPPLEQINEFRPWAFSLMASLSRESVWCDIGNKIAKGIYRDVDVPDTLDPDGLGLDGHDDDGFDKQGRHRDEKRAAREERVRADRDERDPRRRSDVATPEEIGEHARRGRVVAVDEIVEFTPWHKIRNHYGANRQTD